MLVVMFLQRKPYITVSFEASLFDPFLDGFYFVRVDRLQVLSLHSNSNCHYQQQTKCQRQGHQGTGATPLRHPRVGAASSHSGCWSLPEHRSLLPVCMLTWGQEARAQGQFAHARKQSKTRAHARARCAPTIAPPWSPHQRHPTHSTSDSTLSQLRTNPALLSPPTTRIHPPCLLDKAPLSPR